MSFFSHILVGERIVNTYLY